VVTFRKFSAEELAAVTAFLVVRNLLYGIILAQFAFETGSKKYSVVP
jgi:hypothetical protein